MSARPRKVVAAAKDPPPGRFVALFRGINVGKAKRLAMADLRALFAELGYTEVKTLLNSGNVVFTAPSEPPLVHARKIRAAVAEKFGVDALVIVKSARDIAAVVAGNALLPAANNPSRLLVALVHDAKSLAKLDTLAKEQWGDEAIHMTKHAAYIWCANGILESKVAVALLKGLGESGTTRNWATIEKIHVLLRD
jgi:uncharacterized protein (DUF1697 family)